MRSPEDSDREPLSAWTLAAYSAPAFAFAAPTIPVYIYLPAVYADELGLGLIGTGGAILVARAFDTISDPVVGALSDRTRSRHGMRKPWIVLGAVAAAIGLFMLAYPPAAANAVYLTLALVVLFSGWTAVNVPYLAWGAELARDYDARTRLTSAREGVALAGMLVAAGVPALVDGTSSARFQLTAWMAIAIGAIAVPILARYVPDRALMRDCQTAQSSGSARTIASMVANLPFVRLAVAWFINGLANGLPAVLFIFYLTYALAVDASVQPVFVVAYFLSSLLAIPGVIWLSQWVGKHRAWCLAMIAACAAFATVPLLTPEHVVWFGVVCVVTGAALAADIVLPPALQADVIDLDRLRHGEERTAIYMAVWNVAAKSATALAAGLGLVAVGGAGFDPTAVDERGIMALVVAYSIVPIGLKLAAIALLWSFPLTARRHAAIRNRLRSRNPR